MLKIFVKCPFCGNTQATQSVNRKKCVYCGRSFSIYIRKRGKGFVKSRIAGIEKGSLSELYKVFYIKKSKQSFKRKI